MGAILNSPVFSQNMNDQHKSFYDGERQMGLILAVLGAIGLLIGLILMVFVIKAKFMGLNLILSLGGVGGLISGFSSSQSSSEL